MASNNEVILKFIEEFEEDFKKNGEGKEPEVWLKEALKRRNSELSDEEIDKIVQKLVKGIDAYTEAKESKKSIKTFLKEIGKYTEELYKKIIGEVKELLQISGIDEKVIDKIEEETKNEK